MLALIALRTIYLNPRIMRPTNLKLYEEARVLQLQYNTAAFYLLTFSSSDGQKCTLDHTAAHRWR